MLGPKDYRRGHGRRGERDTGTAGCDRLIYVCCDGILLYLMISWLFLKLPILWRRIALRTVAAQRFWARGRQVPTL
ncbi:hypothetical protein M513_13554 [Trichuris suis]|uniref:Uncharacterized protein n=1 Tax=Trichuris suis TaxID=68888 RepID=A0A085LKR9_9BILA|nr:hypothetical protein M513_13554 [Trichuris suis]